MSGLIIASIVVAVVSSGLLLALRKKSSWAASSLAVSGGVVAGNLAWLLCNEYSAEGVEATWTSALHATWDLIRSPREASHWMVPILIGSWVAAWVLEGGNEKRPLELAIATATGPRRWPLVAWAALFAAILFRLLLGSVYLTRRWSGLTAVAMIAAHSAPWALFASWTQVPVSPRVRSVQWNLVSIVMIAATAVIGMSGSAVYAQWSAMACVSLIVCTLRAWWLRRGEDYDRFPIGVVSVVMATHVWLAHFFAELTLADGALLMAAWGAAVGYGRVATRSPQWKWSLLTTSLILPTIAVAHAAWTLRQTLSESVGY